MLHPDKLFGRLGNKMFQMAYVYAQMREGNIPDIYVQDPKYFDKYRNEIKQLFGENIPSKTYKVAIHVRRGDYVNNPFYVDLTQTNYYEKAIAEFPDAEFLVFSDDIEWCKDYFIGEQYSFSEGNDELTDLNLMASCKGHIIANSSFSWWGAYISPYSKKVVAPKLWYTDLKQRTLCPDEWIRV